MNRRLVRRRARSTSTAAVLAAMVLTTMTLTAAPAPAAGALIMASHSPVGPATAPVGVSGFAKTSTDGAYVVFESTAANLVTGQSDASTTGDVFLYQRSTGTVTLVSHASGSATTAGNGVSRRPVISSDGAYVAYESMAKNLVAGGSDPKGTEGSDVFLYSRATGATTLVSRSTASATTHGNDSAHRPSISADGGFVAFESYATTHIAGTDPVGTADVFVFSRSTGVVTLASHTPASATTTGNGASDGPHISANGAFVVFKSIATNLVAGQTDTNAKWDIFLFERATGALTLVTHIPVSATTTANGGTLVIGNSEYSISADGGFVAFSSSSTNQVGMQTDTNNTLDDVYLYERATAGVVLVSHVPANTATTANEASGSPVLSADGAYVAFVSSATNLVPGQNDANFSPDLFLYARATTALTLISHTPGSSTTTTNLSRSDFPSLSADASVVAFQSYGTNVVPGQTDSNSRYDVFLWSRATGVNTLVSHIATSSTTTGIGANNPSLSGNGTVLAFQSNANNLVAGQNDANGSDDIFVHVAGGGGGGDVAPPADFDGDGDTDISVFRPASNTWFVRNGATVSFGASGDIPVPCDYDGDGDTDIAVFRPSVGGWYVQNQATVFLGASGDVPVPADYDGDGDCEPALFRPAVGGWYRVGVAAVFFGLNGDIPVPADYNGDGAADIAVFRPSVGGWYRNGTTPIFYGLNGDIPVPVDFNGNGAADMALYRPSVGGWYINDGSLPTFLGLSTDIPVPGDYDGNGSAERAVFRPAAGAWYVGASPAVFFGISGDRPLPLPSAIRQPFFP
jgi:hypothetical protein